MLLIRHCKKLLIGHVDKVGLIVGQYNKEELAMILMIYREQLLGLLMIIT
jgi:hypothetical protein